MILQHEELKMFSTPASYLLEECVGTIDEAKDEEDDLDVALGSSACDTPDNRATAQMKRTHMRI